MTYHVIPGSGKAVQVVNLTSAKTVDGDPCHDQGDGPQGIRQRRADGADRHHGQQRHHPCDRQCAVASGEVEMDLGRSLKPNCTPQRDALKPTLSFRLEPGSLAKVKTASKVCKLIVGLRL